MHAKRFKTALRAPNRIAARPRAARTASRFASILSGVRWLLPALLLPLQGCLFSSGGKGNPSQVSRGYYVFSNPNAYSRLNLDSTYQVQWTTTDTGSGALRLSLYKGDDFLANLSSAVADAGLYSWSLPSTRSLANYRVGSGSGYRLRLTSIVDTSKWDFSPSFELYSRYSGSIVLTSPAKGAKARVDSSLAISWSASSEAGSLVGLQLYKDTALARTILSGTTAASGAYLWSLVSTNLGSGDDYHIRVFSTADPSIGQMGPAFSISTAWSGGYAIRSPAGGETFTAGSSAPIAWTQTGNPGTYAALSLWKDSAQVAALTSIYTAGTDSATWIVPPGVVSGNYRLRLASSSDPAIFAFSPVFAVKGADPDAYEKDDSLGAAREISVDGKPQQHALTYQDSDWMRFSAKAGKRYLVSLRTGATVYLETADSAGRMINRQYGTAVQYVLDPKYSGKHLVHVYPYSSSSTVAGAYQVSVTEYDSSASPFRIAFSAPDSQSVWASGSSYAIAWTPDSLNFGTSVLLALFDDTSLVQTLTSYTSNSGSYSWLIPSGLYTGSKYRIRISAYGNPLIYAFGPPFTISGATPDAYEPDDSRGQAKAIADDGVAQQRNLIVGDSDWVRFDAVAGRTYLASVNSASASAYLYVTDSLGVSLATPMTGSRISSAFSPTRPGRYYLRIQYYSGAGNYALSLASYEGGQGGLPVRFGVPDTATVWSAGSSYTAAWTPDSALFGNYVVLSLYRGDLLVASLNTYAPNSGTAQVTLPYGLATGGNYRLRMANYSNAALFGYGPSFSIAGTAPDSLEPNDSSAAAAEIVPNEPRRSLSLTYRDKDWFRFPAKAQKLYLIRAASASTFATVIRLWPENGGATYLLTGTKPSGDTLNSLAWVPAADGEYLISVEASTATAYGTYGLEVKEVDPAGYRFGVTAPAAGASFQAGQILPVQWSDPSSVKGLVDLFLYNGDGLVQTIAAGVSNTGTYSWTIPGGLPARTDYSVRVMSRLSSGINGTSEAFSLSP